ncbi:DUF3037 domain-containing protein [Apilactobacillus sp. TMW 2.2459]|uniref:DUF3037 domain-containing protein n=1 Tax=Apilactobacillus xinyiensis TaxID=2841032 RepID=UPI00200CFA06|nr:DUF3037 domain-containing protein [Apilactobacillus xinyiensis]MCL0312906.1 DUF3037 domain-containing protein [Apilactobacillus xinyiensis]
MVDTKTIRYSVLQYTPSLLRKEWINAGIVFHIIEDKISYFVSTKNLSRIKSFNDECNISYFKAIMGTFHEQFDYPLLNQTTTNDSFYNFDDIESEDFLEKRVCNYANEFRFLEVRALSSNNYLLEKDLKNIKDNYLYYDKPANKRIDEKTVRSLLNRQLRIRFNKLSIKKYPKNGNIPFISKPIFYFKSGNDYYKTLTFDYSNDSSANKELKCSIFDISEFLKSPGKEDANIIFIVNNNYKDKISIYNEFIEYIKKVYNNSNHKFFISSVEEFSICKKTKIN